MDKYDVAVIGGGPGGYVAAIRSAQLGMRTVCIDNFSSQADKPSLGGTCLNVGCIPSKALLDSSEHYHIALNGLVEHGISVGQVSLDIDVMMGRKQEVVSALTGGIAALLHKNKVTSVHGTGRLLADMQIEVRQADGEILQLQAANIIIATGSVPAELPDFPFDHDRIVDSTDALAFGQVPARLGIVGAGAIALELGSVWNRLGAKVTIMQRGEAFLPAVDQVIAKAAYKTLIDQGLDIQLGMVPQAAKLTSKQLTLTVMQQGQEQKLRFDKLLVAAGRRPNTNWLNALAVGLKVDDKGFIEVDEFCQTNLKNVYAIGDVVRGPMLAHKASEEGVMVAERLAGEASQLNYDTIPSVIYTFPEVAWVGRTEQQLQADQVRYHVGSFPFKANGRARAMAATAGMVRMLVDADSDLILGVHVFGANASELIAAAVLAMEFGATAEDLALTIHAHPTLSEAVHEAALAARKRAIHF